MTRITLDDGTSILAEGRSTTLLAALGTGEGRVGVRDEQTRRWVWVEIARIREIDGRPPPRTHAA